MYRAILFFMVCALAANAIHSARWRHIPSSRSPPKDVREAKALHEFARQKVGIEMGKHGASATDTVSFGASLFEPPTDSPVIFPRKFGADPTGKTDSTQAFNQAMKALTDTSSHTSQMAFNITNLGGATLDLEGGEYLISSPLVIPVHVGNVRIRGGTLRASKTFNSSRFLIEIGDDDCPVGIQGVCNEFIGLDNLFLDAGHNCAGGVLVQRVMGTTIGPSVFFIGFVEAGIRVLHGHETIISDAWLAEYYWTDDHNISSQKSIAIDLHGEDNVLTNVIVFAYAKVGVLVDGAATLLTGVHTWNGGGVGISINGSYDRQDRLIGCYLDYNVLEIVQPQLIIVQDTFFLHTNAVLYPQPRPVINGVTFSQNMYSLGNMPQGTKTIEIRPVESDLPFTADECNHFVVEGTLNFFPADGMVETSASLTKRMVNATSISFDFGDMLVFGWIESVMYSVAFAKNAGRVSHGAREPDGTTVTVEFDANTTATVTMQVAQCLRK